MSRTDSSAGMRYKESLSEILPRPIFYDLFLRVRDDMEGGPPQTASALAHALAAAVHGADGGGLVITEAELFK